MERVESGMLPALEPIFRWCDDEGVCSRIAVDFFPKINSYVDLEQIGETPLLTFSGAPADEVLLLVKRAVDIVLATAGIILLSPLLLVVAAMIKLTSAGPVIFRQVRCGLNGRILVQLSGRRKQRSIRTGSGGCACAPA
jgi:hypothetical protein